MRVVEILENEKAYNGWSKIEKVKFRHTKNDGSMSEIVTREVMNRGNAACVMVYDPYLDSVLLLEEFRPGALIAGIKYDECWTLGPIAGMIDQGETPEQAAIREAYEESGTIVSPSDLYGPLKFLPSPGACSEIIYSFIVLGDLSNISGNYGVEGEGEDIKPVVMKRNDAIDYMLNSDKIVVGHSLNLVLWLNNLIHENKIVPKNSFSLK